MSKSINAISRWCYDAIIERSIRDFEAAYLPDHLQKRIISNSFFTEEGITPICKESI